MTSAAVREPGWRSVPAMDEAFDITYVCRRERAHSSCSSGRSYDVIHTSAAMSDISGRS